MRMVVISGKLHQKIIPNYLFKTLWSDLEMQDP